MTPYTLPDGNVLVSFSGGRTSGYMLHEILQANGDLPSRCKVTFANTGREMPETLDFVQEVSERWAVPVTWLEYRKDKRWQNWFPLANAGADLQTVMDFWKAQSFDLRVMPGLGNCDGCFLKSEATLAAAWREHPDRMQWWADMEHRTNGAFHKTRTYAELGSFVSRQGDWIFDDENFLCQADDGECTA